MFDEFLYLRLKELGKVKNLELTKQELRELKNLARHNKSNVLHKKIRLNVNGNEYELIIKGVGNKAVKLELYLNYERILSNKDIGIIEGVLWEKLNKVYHKEAPQTIGNKRVI